MRLLVNQHSMKASTSLTASKVYTIVSCISSRAAWTSWNASGERPDQSSSQSGDRVRDVTFGPDRRRLWVDNRREAQVAGATRRDEGQRGESSPVRGSGIRKPRGTAWRGGGRLANLGLRSVQARAPVSAPDNRAR